MSRSVRYVVARLSPKGVSLFEVMVTIGLFLTFLVAAGGLVRKASRVLRFSDKKSASMRAMTYALDRVRRDLAGAQQLNSPASGSAATLEFLIVDPTQTERLFPAVSPPNFPMLALNVAPYMLKVEFALNADSDLERTATRSGTVISTGTVAENLRVFTCERRSDNAVEVRLEMNEEREGRSLSTVIPLLEGVP
jgi:hypothetical protein